MWLGRMQGWRASLEPRAPVAAPHAGGCTQRVVMKAQFGMPPAQAAASCPAKSAASSTHMPGGSKLLDAGVVSVSLPLALDAMVSHRERWSAGNSSAGVGTVWAGCLMAGDERQVEQRGGLIRTSMPHHHQHKGARSSKRAWLQPSSSCCRCARPDAASPKLMLCVMDPVRRKRALVTGSVDV